MMAPPAEGTMLPLDAPGSVTHKHSSKWTCVWIRSYSNC